jgi:hypothetical protein
MGADKSPQHRLTTIQEDTMDVDSTEISFHVDAKTIFKVGERMRFKVSSLNVASASSVWSRMLFGPSCDNSSSKPEPVVIEVDDDGPALRTLMNIIHYKFNEVPAQPNLDELWNITQLTSKYKCTHLIYPWASKWISAFSNFVTDDECPSNNHKAAWVAWELGDVKLLKDMSDSMIAHAKVDCDGDLINNVGVKLKDLVLPPGLLGEYICSILYYRHQR